MGLRKIGMEQCKKLIVHHREGKLLENGFLDW